MSIHTDTDRIRVEQSTAHIRVTLDGEVLADSTRPLALHETGLPVRYYVPPQDVRTDLLQESDTKTHCPWKGDATHWSAAGTADVAWSYPAAREPAREVEGHFSFYDERVRLEIDE
ncbi:MAG: DUF427 domain-containing protein [Thermoleophilaceae bacterium]